jgi:hypothetical protein
MPTISAQADPDRPEAVEFYRRLGMCIAGWAFVDRCLYQVFHHAVGLEQKQSALFYYGDRTFGRRLDLVDRALKAELPNQEFVDEWRPLRDATRVLSHTRNIIVHQPTLRTATSKDGVPIDIYEIYIEPYERILNNDPPGLPGKETVGIDDLQAHEKDVAELHGKLSTFAWKMGGRRAAMRAGS